MVDWYSSFRDDHKIHAMLLVVRVFFFAGLIVTLAKTEVTKPWHETLPAVAMDYKVHIDPGKEDCYFQYVNPGATFYVSFQVFLQVTLSILFPYLIFTC